MVILIGIWVTLLVGILPMLVYACILWWFDRYEKEPLALLIAAFLWGAAPAAIFSLVAELILHIPISYFVDPVAANLIDAAVIAPIAEEIFKGLALLLLFLFFRQEIDSPLDGIIYGGLVGFGFATVENLFYFTGALVESGVSGVILLATMRAFVFGLNHALFTGLTGLGMALARTERNWTARIGAPVAGLLLGITAHSVHNASVTAGAGLCWPFLLALVSNWGGVLALAVVVIWSMLWERHWIVTYLADEVAAGTLSREDYATVSSSLQRMAARASALLTGGFGSWWHLGRYHHLATELAFSKHRLARFPGETETQARIVRLRKQLVDLRQGI